jgi:P27 family predicted phage terminase small subunit
LYTTQPTTKLQRGGAGTLTELIAPSHFSGTRDSVRAIPKAPVITAFPARTVPEPPPELQEPGRQLWRTVMAKYLIEDTHAELLKLACLSADAAASMRKQIRDEGETVTGSTGQLVAHPLIAAEGAAQKRVAQFLKQLGLFDEPKRDRPGRPPKLGGF